MNNPRIKHPINETTPHANGEKFSGSLLDFFPVLELFSIPISLSLRTLLRRSGEPFLPQSNSPPELSLALVSLPAPTTPGCSSSPVPDLIFTGNSIFLGNNFSARKLPSTSTRSAGIATPRLRRRRFSSACLVAAFSRWISWSITSKYLGFSSFEILGDDTSTCQSRLA